MFFCLFEAWSLAQPSRVTAAKTHCMRPLLCPPQLHCSQWQATTAQQLLTMALMAAGSSLLPRRVSDALRRAVAAQRARARARPRCRRGARSRACSNTCVAVSARSVRCNAAPARTPALDCIGHDSLAAVRLSGEGRERQLLTRRCKTPKASLSSTRPALPAIENCSAVLFAA